MLMSVVQRNHPDPIDSQNHETLRLEILRLRDLVLGAESQTEVLKDNTEVLKAKVTDLQQQNTELNQALHELASNSELTIQGLLKSNEYLHTELQHTPVMRIARAVARRLKLL